MGGCTNCKGKSGCDHRKGAMLAEVDDALARLYPTRTWGDVDDSATEPVAPADLAALADELAGELNAATFVRPGGDDEPCDFIYVLCLGRAPCIVQVRDHDVAPPDEWRHRPDSRIDEMYLRIAIAHRARMAAVQQVAIDATAAPGGWIVREAPRAGVYDAPLLHRMQKLVAILPAYDLKHLDFGEIAHPPPGFEAGPWRDLYGGAPAIANYLFYPQPTTMTATAFVAEPVAARAQRSA
jgi:hypothetical protein